MGAPIIWTAAWLGSRLITPRLIAGGSAAAGRYFGAELARTVSATLNHFITRNIIGAEVQHALRHLMRGAKAVAAGDTIEAEQEIKCAVRAANDAEVRQDLGEADRFIRQEAEGEPLERAAQRLSDEIRSRVPVRTGELAGSVGWERYYKTGEIRVGYGIKYRVRTAHLVELGTKPHVIAPSARRTRPKKALADRQGGVVYGRAVKHPGQRGLHILRDVMASESHTVVDTYKVRLKEKIEGRYGA